MLRDTKTATKAQKMVGADKVPEHQSIHIGMRSLDPSVHAAIVNARFEKRV